MLCSVVRMSSIADNIGLISCSVSKAYQDAGTARAAHTPRLVAVSKTKPKEAIIEAYQAGHRVFGENYVQELVEKSQDSVIQSTCPDIEWHFIGHCQSQKAKVLMKCPRLSTVETVTSTKLATKLNNAATSPVRVFIQVNTSGEENKNGVEPSQVMDLVKFITDNCPNLQFHGLMTIGNLDNSIASSETGENPDFSVLVNTRSKVAAALGKEETALELSMGMSKDYKEAIMMGSTNVRVGSQIFGARNYPGNTTNTANTANTSNTTNTNSVETITDTVEKVSL